MTKKICIMMLLLVSFFLFSGEKTDSSSDNPSLYPIKKDGLWGFIDKTGKVVVEPKFKFYMVHRSSEGLAAAAELKEERIYWGYIDSNANWVIQPQYFLVQNFSNGLAAVCVRLETSAKKGTAWGYIDKTGQWVIKPRFEMAGHFIDNIASVEEQDQFFLIDKEGNRITSGKFSFISGFNDGLARASIIQWFTGERINGYIDQTGKWIIKPQYPWANDFSEGLATVMVGKYERGAKGWKAVGKWGFVNTKGELVIEPQFDSAEDFHEGLAAVSLTVGDSCLWGYINTNGEMIIKPQFDMEGQFSGGLAFAAVWIDKNQETKYGVIDKKGEFVIEPIYDFHYGENYEFDANGIAEIFPMVYIDQTGKYIWEPTK